MSQPPKGNALPISIFPFLDVLVCTMGSLILILILISARIRSQPAAALEGPAERAVESTPAPMPAPDTESPEAADVAEGSLASTDGPSMEPREPAEAEQPEPERAEPTPSPPDGPTPRDRERELREKIAELSERLDAERAALRERQQSVAAARRRALEAQAALRDVQGKIAEMIEGAEQNDEEQRKLQEERERLERELAELNRQIRRSKESKHDAASKFAFIPYDGVSGTTRRPILIECTDKGLTFIPEDVELKPEDVVGFTEKANPLLAGSAALSRYWSTVDNLKGDGSNAEGTEAPEPYVLLIVRPSGTIAFYYAQRMLSRMKHSFGYELLDDERALDIPPADPKARELCLAAVTDMIARRDKTGQGGDGASGDGFPSLGRSPFRSERGRGTGGDAAGPSTGALPGDGDGDEQGPGGASGARGIPGSGVAGTPGSNPGTGGGTAGRKVRFRPGVGFEVVESDESEAKIDDPFERALRAREGSASGKRGFGSQGASQDEVTGTVGASVPLRGGAAGGGVVGGGAVGAAPGESIGSAGPTRGGKTEGTGIGSSAPSPDGLGDASGGTDARSVESATAAGGPKGRGTRAPGTGSQPPADGNDAPATGNATGGTNATGDPTSRGGSKTGASDRGGGNSGGANSSGSTAGDSTSGSSAAGSSTAGGAKTGGSGGQGGSSAARGDEELAGPGASFGPLAKRNAERAPTNRRWGYYSRRASIGFQRTIDVVATSDRLIIGKSRMVPLEEGTSPQDVAEAVSAAVEAEVRSWGRPPDSFYYVPTLQFSVAPGAEASVEALRGPLKRDGLSSTVKPADTANAKPETPSAKKSSGAAPGQGVTPSNGEFEWKPAREPTTPRATSPGRTTRSAPNLLPADNRNTSPSTETRYGAPPSR